ncbi:DUF1778 domain-containing protein [Vibrio splendidus]|uniref:type II toxin-antitoxin system TacA family antitoxin n=1 Tax=Vibrio splendidus TaxID=29497 RepID=UPI001FB21122|nr:DUF1778 domain-containing protein [Vibrio splendidus]UOE86915.1 DUF1778 domain-containing protein [Vibrio splendidus]UOE91766.1 DUF1778 domain-containing protein [Vibrio splendidus]
MNKKRLTGEKLLESLIAYGVHADDLNEVDIQEWTAMLEQAEPILLSEEDYNRLIEALERPPKPNEALKKAFEKNAPGKLETNLFLSQT